MVGALTVQLHAADRLGPARCMWHQRQALVDSPSCSYPGGNRSGFINCRGLQKSQRASVDRLAHLMSANILSVRLALGMVLQQRMVPVDLSTHWCTTPKAPASMQQDS